MNDTKTSSDESPECDSDPNTVVANMTPEDRAEYLAWVAECAAANLAHQMEHDGPDPAECGCATPTDSERTEADLRSGTMVATAPTEPTTRTFMVTVNYRGSMHVAPLRTFVVEDEARKYAKTLTGGTPVLYETFTSKPPKKLKV